MLLEESVLTNICEQQGILQSLYVISFLLNTIKILVPVVIIIMGIVAFAKEFLNDKNDLGKPIKTLVVKFIVACLIPFVYTILISLFNYFDVGFNESNYTCIWTCLKSQEDCKGLQKSSK